MNYAAATKRNRELIKAQQSRRQYLESSIRVLEGSGMKGVKAKPFNYEAAINEFKGWVYAAISLNMNAVASLPLRLFVNVPAGQRVRNFKTIPVDKRSKAYLRGRVHGQFGRIGPHKYTSRKIIEFGDDFEEVVSDHPILDLIRTVNPWFNGYDLIQLAVIYLELTGNSYWHTVIGPLGVPVEIWPMPSQWVWVKPSRENFIDGYVYGRDSATATEFGVDEVIHFRTANPGRDGLFYGRGKIEAGWDAIALNDSNHQMDRAFSDNNARPDYVAFVKGSIQPGELDRFEAKVEQKLRGTREAGRFLAMQGDMRLEPLNFPPKDLMGRDDTIEEIAAIIGVPVSMLKANDPNLASSKSGYAQWRETSTLPIATLIEQKLNEQLIPMFGLEGRAVLAFDNPVPADRMFELNEAVQVVNAGINTRDEVRIERGDEPKGGAADELLVTAGLVPVDEAGQQGPGGIFSLGGRAPSAPAAIAATPIDDERVARIAASAAIEAVKVMKNEIIEAVNQKAKAATVKHHNMTIQLTEPEGRAGGTYDKNSEAGKRHEAYRAEMDKRRGDFGGWLDQMGNAPMTKLQSDLIYDDREHKAACCNSPGLKFESHEMNYMPMGFESWHKVDADEDVREDQPASPEDRMRSAIATVLADFGDRVVTTASKTINGRFRAKLTSRQIDASLKELEGLGDALADAIEESMGQMIDSGGRAGAAKLSELTSLEVGFDVSSPNVVAQIRDQSVLLARTISQTTVNRISEILEAGLRDAALPKDISAAIEESAMFTRSRAEAIARTESANAFIEGNKQSWRESAVVQGVKWVLAPNACEFCQSVAKQFEGKVQPLDEPFVKLGDSVVGTEGGVLNVDYRDITGPPLHPNDRCALVPVLIDPGG